MGKRTVKLNKNNMYVADYETTDDLEDGSTSNQRVWLAGYMNVETKDKKVFTSQGEFFKNLLKLGSNKSVQVYFHNLKFDGSFIIPHLETSGYKYVERVSGPKEYSVLIDQMNNWFSINIQHNKQGKVLIYDTYKMFPTSLEYLPNQYGTPTKKIIEDSSFYNEWRSPEHEPTEEESKYFHNDLQVLAETMGAHYDWFGGTFKTTQASQAWYSFTKSFPAWQWRFPPLEDKEDADMRTAYIGGTAYVPKKYAGITLYGINVLDVNSMYPHKAAFQRLPYGKAEYVEGNQHPPMSKFWVAKVWLKLKLKENCLPSISSKQKARTVANANMVSKDKWVHNTNYFEPFVISSIDYETMLESYEYEVLKWEWHYKYKQKVHKEVQDFVLMNNKIKEESQIKAQEAKDKGDIDKYWYYTAKRQRAKIDNNAFYGKFGEAIVKYNKVPEYTEEHGVRYGTTTSKTSSTYTRKYLPVAIAITAWARQQLVRMANTLGEDFLYCDTDSVHIKQEGMIKVNKAVLEGSVELHDSKLGAWSLEGEYKRGKYLRPKCYIEETLEGENEVTLAGLPSDPHTGFGSKSRSCITFENLDFGTYIPPEKSNKLRSLRTPTGTKLIPTGFRIKENEEDTDIELVEEDEGVLAL